MVETPPPAPYDCAIIGGGPSGLTCAIFLARYRRRVLVLDAGRPRNWASHGVHGFLGQHGILPAELLRRGRLEAFAVGVEILDHSVRWVRGGKDAFEVDIPGGSVLARRLVLAYGIRDVLPDIPSFETFYGRSIFHCPDCDGYEVSDRRVGVIGSGKKAVGLTLELLLWTRKLRVFTHGAPPDLSAEAREKLRAEGIPVQVERIAGFLGKEGRLEAVQLETGERVELDALFFTLGKVHCTPLAEDIGCRVLDEPPVIEVDDRKETSIPGVYAVGDLVSGSQLAVTAAADGAIAAIAINKSLMPVVWKV